MCARISLLAGPTAPPVLVLRSASGFEGRFGLGGRGLPHAESLTCACPRPLPAPDPSLKLARREDIPAARVPSAHAGEKLANRARRRAICGARADYESRSTAGDHP